MTGSAITTARDVAQHGSEPAVRQAPYDDGFFRDNVKSARKSARPILEMLQALYHPTSIVDIGCGSGGWLAAAEQLGFAVLRGYDGPWADPTKYTSKNIDFRPVNLEHDTFEHDRRYDLAMSVEVAEHLSESRADHIVDLLCAASDVVLFGAAIPLQGGTHHIHERPQSYWVEKFRARGYEPFDVIRPAVWDNGQIGHWFRQNVILYVKEAQDVIDRDVLRSLERPLWDVVHPAHLQRKVKRWRDAAGDLRSARDEISRLNAEQRRLQRRIRQLENSLQTQGPRRRSLRTVRPADVPEPLRPVVMRVWRQLPQGVRARVRSR